MASTKKKQDDCTYDWDDFDVGNILANDSEGFFQGVHKKQEALLRYWQQKEEFYITTRELENSVRKYNNGLKDAKQFELSKPSNKVGDGIKDVPKAYSFKDIYEKKKKQALQRIQEEERKLREFRSRPMPKFQASHKQNTHHKVTFAITPNTLKISRDLEEKRKEQLAKMQQQQELEFRKKWKPKVCSIAYLREQPFIPKKSKSDLEVKPFHFCTEERAEKRKLFNAHIKEIAEARKIDEARKRVQQLEAEIEIQRRLTDFKARPNPFRKYSSVENVSSKNKLFKLYDF